MKINNIKDVKKAFEKIVNNIVKGKIPYFAFVVFEKDGSFTNCYFSPIVKNGEESLCVTDYITILHILLSHQNIEEIEYDEGDNIISAIFKDPFEEEDEGYE